MREQFTAGVEEHHYRDEHGRILPGLVPGWGMSWWWHEQGLDPHAARAMTMKERMAMVGQYWDAVAAGWRPPVRREQWVGPHHPFDAAE